MSTHTTTSRALFVDKRDALIARELTRQSLQDLIDGRLLAIRLDFLSAEACAGISAGLDRQPRQAYTHELYADGRPVYLHYGVDRIGTPFNTTYHQPQDSPAFQQYYRDARAHMRMMEEVCRPFGGNPILRFISRLNQAHPQGASIAEFHGRRMFAGIVRIMEPHLEGKARLEEQPHFDSLPPSFYPLAGQLSANIYIALPKPVGPGEDAPGGELELWDVPPQDPAVIEAAAADTDWRSLLPESHRITPRLGELILINTRRPHAVRMLQRGLRVSVQTFIGVIPHHRLLCWN